MDHSLIHACNVTSCIRNLTMKSHAPLAAFSIERTCTYAKEKKCQVNIPGLIVNKANRVAPMPQSGSAATKTCQCVKCVN